MHRKDFLVNDCCNGQAVEAIGERLPQFDIISPLAFIVEPIYAVDRCTLVVPTQDEEVLGILDLIREKQADCFKGLFASVDVVPKKEVVCFRWESSVFKEAEKVVILAMNITTDLRQAKKRISVALKLQNEFCQPDN